MIMGQAKYLNQNPDLFSYYFFTSVCQLENGIMTVPTSQGCDEDTMIQHM
jgi:hypothetical protein